MNSSDREQDRADREIRRRLQREADDLLFAELRFDARLKHKIAEQAQEDRYRAAWRSRFGNKRAFRPIGAIAAAAVVAVLLFVSGPSLFPSSPQPSPAPTAEGRGGAVETAPPGEDQQPNHIFTAPLTGSNQPPGSPPPGSAEQIWQLPSFNEAREAFGENLLVPSYVPEGFALREINASGLREGIADSIVYSYVSGSRSFGLFQQKQERSDPPLENGKTVDINGHTGYMAESRTDGAPAAEDVNAEIHWYADGVQYMVSGLLSADEALEVARSLAKEQPGK